MGSRAFFEVNRPGGFAVPKRQMRAELVGKRPHRIVLSAGRNPQGPIALGARFLDQSSEQNAADTPATQASLDAEGDLGLQILRRLRRMKFRRASDDAIFEVSDDEGSVVSAFGCVTLDETVIHIAVKTVVATMVIEPQQMIPEQRKLFLLAQRPNGAFGSRGVVVAHFQSPLGSPRGGVESLSHLYCASQHEIQGRIMPRVDRR